MPLVSQTFDQLIDFTRTTAGTFVGSNGLIQNTPASRNLLTFTQDFDNITWSKNNTTVTANATTAPDGTLTADKLEETATTAVHSALRSITTTAVAYTWSCYVKAAERNFALLYHTQSNSSLAVNLTTGATDTASGTVAPTSSSVVAVGNGWWRISMTVTATAATNSFSVHTMNDLVSVSYAGTAGSGIFVWGAQIEVGTLTDYTRNNGGVYPPRFDYDPVTLAPRGLLVEEQRTNLLTYSEQFDNAAWVKTRASVTANATTAPDGTASADKLIEDTANNTHTASQTLTIATATSYTYSTYLKAAERTFARVLVGDTGGNNAVRVDVNLSTGAVSSGVNGTGWTLISATATAVGNGWYRVTVAGTGAAATTGTVITYLASALGTITYTGDGTSGIFVWGSLLEVGSFATSYIPTVASQVTRTADTATITGQNFSQWYNQSEGTLVAEWLLTHANATGRYIAQVNSPTVAQGISLWVNSDGLNTRAWVGATSVIAGNASSSTPNKVAFGYRATDNAVSLNGAAAVASSATGPTDGNFFLIGSSGGGINGHIRRITYYPTRLSNAQLQALTA